MTDRLELPDAIDLVRPSIVQIADAAYIRQDLSVLTGERTGKGALGSGFVVDNRRTIVTALHVIDSIPPQQLLVGFAGEERDGVSANFRYWRATVIARAPRQDLALLRLAGLAAVVEITVVHTAQLAIVAAKGTDAYTRQHVDLLLDRPRAGTAIAISGFPLLSPVLVTNAGHLATSRAIDEHELRWPGLEPETLIADPTDVFLADVQANPNNSGGPAYRIEDGAVIGVCKARRLSAVVDRSDKPVTLNDGRDLLQDTGLTVIVPARFVANLLDEAGLGEPSDEP